ncbi:MAG: glutamate--tRNA ligase, partial [Alphaproteobacteria bacterium HGW-Alphaproteobacteria-10]|jgi:glutamyl-tRNA synthetase
VRWGNDQLDDLVLLRSDGVPTYMLAVVVDDHDMGVTHVIRGDDHLTNAARQSLIYQAMGWATPVFAHIPLIHGPDGAKLSKRHGALGVDAYRDMGYLPAAMRNYLARLGWGHGDDEYFTDAQAQAWFDLSAIGKAPARLDFAKLADLNGRWMRDSDDAALVAEIARLFAAQHRDPLSLPQRTKLAQAMPGLKQRAKTLMELIDSAYYILGTAPITPDDKAVKLLTPEARALLGKLTPRLRDASEWSSETLESAVRAFAEEAGVKLGSVAQPLRAALTGRATSPGVFDVLVTLGRDESLARIAAQAR